MELNRRQILLASVAVPVVMNLPGIANAAPTFTGEPKQASFVVHRMSEYYGPGDYGSPISWYAEGHISPVKVASQIDMDDVVTILGNKAQTDDGEFVDEATSLAELAAMTKHTYARWERPECECGEPEGCDDCEDEKIFMIVPAGTTGAFPATVIDIG